MQQTELFHGFPPPSDRFYYDVSDACKVQDWRRVFSDRTLMLHRDVYSTAQWFTPQITNHLCSWTSTTYTTRFQPSALTSVPDN